MLTMLCSNWPILSLPVLSHSVPWLSFLESCEGGGSLLPSAPSLSSQENHG